MNALPEDAVRMINELLGGYDRVMGLRIVEAALDKVVAELEVGEPHRQSYGLVHGGVFTGMIETLCSVGAALNVMPHGRHTVGLENTTSFLRAVRGGTLRCTAVPLVRGRRSHVWQAEIHDERGRLAATGRVRMLVLETGAEADGAEIGLHGGRLGDDRRDQPA